MKRKKYSRCENKFLIKQILSRSRCRAKLNISGHIYETEIQTLERFPNTLLGNREKRKRFYNSECNQYFLNRSRIFFDAILFFYQSGILTCPKFVPCELFVEECRFFELPEDVILRSTSRNNFRSVEEDYSNKETNTPTGSSLKLKIWDILQHPHTSSTAKVFSTVSLTAVVLSVLSSILQSVTEKTSTSANQWMFLELILNIWFLLELILSCIFSPNKKKFFRSTMTWIDILAVIPYFVVLVVDIDKLDSLKFLRILRLFRVCRIFRFLKHSKRLAVVGKIFLSCVGDMKVLFLCVVLVVVFAGSVIFYLEISANTIHPINTYSTSTRHMEVITQSTAITTIPIGMYWACQTIFTIGYGDLVPITHGGKIFAGLFMVVAASAFVIPLLSIIAKFQTEWNVDHHWINKCDQKK